MKEKSGRLAGRIAVVTAAGQGIGRAVAERLMADGAEVHASDINAELLATLDGAATTRLDATDHGAVSAYFEGFDRVDILVHAVGYVHQGTVEECSPADWRRSVNITLDSAYNVIAGAIPKMKANSGSIITIGSVASSIKGFPRRAAYGAAKGGVIGLTKAVAADYVSQGIRCNSVCPGTVASPSLEERIGELGEKLGSRDEAYRSFIGRQPAGRFGTVEEVAAICAFLASDEAAFITGQAINIDGGITI
ncbi:SDR family oxidoreductase (plasmid) [Ensifer sp. PDNC004]|uniref:SDR family oxidoreductase n=1 Tax=unclassified Ensifer TaxID=2633371 RepID=UPI00177B6E71|nr:MULTISPECIES: SDR family oxidoreductase [unclassified Ensifer]MBD9652668.1 SDR family oxidoreductase [Ensifer sp. ENS09]QRY65031.1 SDR family oxidoreductase [Ensifer sp. PDNC004]